MPYVIAEPCIDVNDKGLRRGLPSRLHLRGAEPALHPPRRIIDYGACAPVCPVRAIFAEDEAPEQWKHFIGLNRQFFAENPGIQPATKN